MCLNALLILKKNVESKFIDHHERVEYVVTYFDSNSGSDDSIDCWLCKRIKLQSIRSPHEVWFKDVTTPAIVLEDAQVELHSQVC